MEPRPEDLECLSDYLIGRLVDDFRACEKHDLEQRLIFGRELPVDQLILEARNPELVPEEFLVEKVLRELGGRE